jgi:hypothetical protein
MRFHWQGEMRLWAWLMLETWKDLRGRRDTENYVEALAWVLSTCPRYTLNTFDGVCCELGLDEAYVRGDMLRAAMREAA